MGHADPNMRVRITVLHNRLTTLMDDKASRQDQTAERVKAGLDGDRTDEPKDTDMRTQTFV